MERKEALVNVFIKLAQGKPNEDVLKLVQENRLQFPRITKYNKLAKVQEIVDKNLKEIKENEKLTEKQEERLKNMNTCLLGKRAFLNIKDKVVDPEKMGLNMLQSAIIWLNTQTVLMKDAPKRKDEDCAEYQTNMFIALAQYYEVGKAMEQYNAVKAKVTTPLAEKKDASAS
jgi:hypothetical protein